MAWQARKKSKYLYYIILICYIFFSLYLGKGERAAAFEEFFDRLREEKRKGKQTDLADATAPPAG